MNDNSFNKIKFCSNPNNLIFYKNIVEDLYHTINLDNVFTIFKSINDILYLVYSNENKSIISYNLLNNKKINEVKYTHKDAISNFRHYFDKINKIDFVLSLSSFDNNIKIWKISNWECILNLININNNGRLEATCFLYFENKNYILTSSCNYYNTSEPIKIFDFGGNKINEIKESNNIIKFIDIYYDSKCNQTYIITGNKGFSTSYDYKNNKVYNYYKETDLDFHICSIINEINNEVHLLDSSVGGIIRIWNFHTAILINKIDIEKMLSEQILYGLSLWNNEYLFVGNNKDQILLLNLKDNKIEKQLKCNNGFYIATIKKMVHPKYGECLISSGGQGKIQLWVIGK